MFSAFDVTLLCPCRIIYKTFPTAQKMKFSITDFFSKCDQIQSLKKSVMENFIFCAMSDDCYSKI